MSARTFRVGTRASTLARAQTDYVIAHLDAATEVVTISTEGDRSAAALAQIGGTGVFVSALRDALLAGEIDIAVHSFKDLPTGPADGIVVAAVPPREDNRDVLVARDGLTLGELPPGARVGTGSPRRMAQLNALGLGIEVVGVRGNIDTRVGKVTTGEFDAVVLAYAGLRRIGRAEVVTEVLDPIQILPAAAQGALAIECRADDAEAIALVAGLDHADTRATVTAERALLEALEAGCSAPVGTMAEIAEGDDGPEIFLRGSVTALDGSDAVRLSATGPTTDADGVGRRLAAELIADGADTMMGELYMTRARKTVGRITFVGAGPGDPGLVTARATDAIRTAEIVIADAAVPAAVLGLATGEVRPAEAVSAESAKAALTEARNGLRVVRLVAGDPFSDDAVVKETLAVAKTVVPFDVVPGISLGVGTAAYAGVPVGAVRTEVDLADVHDADYETLAAAAGTLVLTVDAPDVETAGEQLVANGLKPDTAVAVSCAGTTTGQQTVVGQLGDLGLTTVGMSGRLVLTIGKAASSRDKLAWWESRSLYGWKVLVPRTKDQAGAMSDRLRGFGAVPVEVPTIAVEPPRTPTQMERAIKGLVTGRFEWIVFTSTNAVRAVREKFEEFGLDARAFAGVKIACVGSATADAVRAFGIKPELVPSDENASSEGLLADFPPYDDVLDPIDRILLPRADIATETLAAGLRELGWEIDDVTAYRTVRAAPPAAEIRDAIKSGGFQAVCFTSSSTVRNLVGIAGKPHARTVVACIGPQTAATAKEFGLRVDVQPEQATVPALIDALAEFAVERAAEEKEKVATAVAKKSARTTGRRASR